MKKIQKLSFAIGIALLTSMSPSVIAFTIDWADTASPFLTLAGGTTGLPSGDLIWLGTNKLSITGMQALQDDPVALAANFAPWATGTIGTGTGVDGSFTINSQATGTGFFNAQLSILIFNAPTPATATQVALISNPAWDAPAADNLALTFDVSDAGLQILIGSLSVGTITTPNDIIGANAIQLYQAVIVPEPSTVFLVGMGLAGAWIVRRRKIA